MVFKFFRALAATALALATLDACDQKPVRDCSSFPEPSGKATLEVPDQSHPEMIRITVVNSGKSPLCFFWRDRPFASDLDLKEDSVKDTLHYPEMDHEWSSPLSNRIVCIPPGTKPVSQHFEVIMGREIRQLGKGDHTLQLTLTAFTPYALDKSQPDRPVALGISDSEFSCGQSRAYTKLLAETVVRVR